MMDANSYFFYNGARIYTVLLVDDSPVNLGVVVENLEMQGYEVLVAQDGEEGLSRAEMILPDIILLDVMMPGMDGFEVCRRLKKNEITRHIPVIFMTSLSRLEDKIDGFNVGAVDYVIKPLHMEELRARIGAHLKLRDLQRQLAEKVVEQNALLGRIEIEQHVASEYMNRLTGLDSITDPAVDFYLKPAGKFNGDVIAASRTPEGGLHLLLADSTGHGLSAALAGMPVIQPFYAMSGKGFDISAIAAEINQKLYQVLPRSHFVAAIFASLDPVQKTVEVWCGGCPPPLLLSPEGKVVHRFRSRHVALSILAPAGFDGAVERFSFGDRDLSLFMFSDGVLEAENQYGEHFGLERLLGALASEAHSARLKNVPEVLEAHCRESNAEHDDITFIMARCQCGGEAAAQKPESGLAKD